MENEFLKTFLKTGLFEIGDNDDRLDKLKKSISILQKNLTEDYSLLPKYTLVAIDPNISDTESVLNETEEIVLEHWETLRSKYPVMPRNILRGVILNALNNIGLDEPIAARIIYLTASNIYPYMKLNKEKEIVASMLRNLGEICEINAVEEWSLMNEETSLKLGSLKVGNLNFEPVKLDEVKFSAKLREAFTNAPSGHGPQHGLNEPNYQNHFISKTTNAIVSSFNSAFDGLNKSFSLGSIETPINKFFVEFKKSLDDNLKSSFLSITAVERRSKILWWKETLYSQSLKRSYRGIDINLLPIIMGVDLNNQVPEITPISVDYLLKDTIFLLNDKKDNQIKFGDFLKVISQKPSQEILKPLFDELDDIEGRISITDFIILLVFDKINIKDFHSRTGIKENDEISISEIAVTVFHDLLTERLISE